MIARATWRDTWKLWRLMCACFGSEAYDPLTMWLMLVRPGARTLHALAPGRRPAGLISCGRAWEGGFAWIVTLGVHPDFRRRGIASRLLTEIEAHVVEPNIRLTVRLSNVGAITLYRRMGYVLIGRVARYYADGEDGLEMEKHCPANVN
jgi:ribosomal protein S18 acetylase RimI-like enzyme